MEANGQTLKMVYTVVERAPGKSFWVKVGVGFVNRDGSITLRLDAIPVNGTLQVREWEPRDEGSSRRPVEGDPDLATTRRTRRDEQVGAPLPRRSDTGLV